MSSGPRPASPLARLVVRIATWTTIGIAGVFALALAWALAVYPVEYVVRNVVWIESDVDDRFRFRDLITKSASGTKRTRAIIGRERALMAARDGLLDKPSAPANGGHAGYAPLNLSLNISAGRLAPANGGGSRWAGPGSERARRHGAQSID